MNFLYLLMLNLFFLIFLFFFCDIFIFATIFLLLLVTFLLLCVSVKLALICLLLVLLFSVDWSVLLIHLNDLDVMVAEVLELLLIVELGVLLTGHFLASINSFLYLVNSFKFLASVSKHFVSFFDKGVATSDTVGCHVFDFLLHFLN